MLNALKKIDNGFISDIVSLHQTGICGNKQNQIANFFNVQPGYIDKILSSSFFSNNKKDREINSYLSYTNFKFVKSNKDPIIANRIIINLNFIKTNETIVIEKDLEWQK